MADDSNRSSEYAISVFVNCPFDDDFRELYLSIVFAVNACGYIARCALEVEGADEARLAKIERIIEECRCGIHDISRVELDISSSLPRFNMPFELGLFLGALRFGEGRHSQKRALVLEREQFRYQQFLSDIAGNDVGSHQNSPEKAVRLVRDWLKFSR